MSKTLVAYFSAGGKTKEVAVTLASILGADAYEIKPEVPYTEDDLNWRNKKSRSSVEMSDPQSRPAMAGKPEDIAGYDTILLGFPIWWYLPPTIVNTFLESADFAGKKILLFATSGGSGIGRSAERLRPSCPGASVREGMVYHGKVSREGLAAWLKTMEL